MALKPRTNMNKRNAKGSASRQPQPWRFPEGPKGTEGRAILSVLVLAAQWPSRFKAGWVTDGDIAEFSRDIPRPTPGDPLSAQSLSSRVRRGVRELEVAEDGLRVVRKPGGGMIPGRHPHAALTRITPPLSPAAQGWFAVEGIDLLEPKAAKDFRKSYYALADDLPSLTATLDAATCDYLGMHQPGEALAHIEHALRRAPAGEHRALLRLSRAEIALRHPAAGHPAAARAALGDLKELLATLGTGPEVATGRLRARALITIASAMALLAEHDPPHNTGRAEGHLAEAFRLVHPDDHSLRADWFLAQFRVQAAASACSRLAGKGEADAQSHNDQAALALRSVFRECGLARRWDVLPTMLYVFETLLDPTRFPPSRAATLGALIRWRDAARSYWRTTGLAEQSVESSLVLLGALEHVPTSEAGFDALPLDVLTELARRCAADAPLLGEAHVRERVGKLAWYHEPDSSPDGTKRDR